MEDANEAYLPIWLELDLDEKSRLFELRAREERAVVVGSHPSCDVRVARAGVASTHFHFEREGDAVVVVPGYRAALIVDNAPAAGPVTLTKSARVEFCGAALEVTVHDVPPLDLLLDARRGRERAPHGPDYFTRLPDDTDPTVQALVAVAPAQAVADRGSGLPEEELDLMTTTAWRAVPPAPTLGPQGTVIMKRPPLVTVAPEVLAAGAPAPLPPIAPTERICLEPWTDSADSPDYPSPQLARPARAVTTPSLTPVEAPVVPTRRHVSALEQLGVTASRYPIRVAAAALPLCAVVALALVGAARLAGWPHAAVPPPHAASSHAQRAASSLGQSDARDLATRGAATKAQPTQAAFVELAVSSAAAALPALSSRPAPTHSASQPARRPSRHVFVKQ